MNILAFINIPICVVFAVYFFRVKIANWVILCCECGWMMFSIGDILALLYFVKPYKKFVLRQMKKVLGRMKRSETRQISHFNALFSIHS